MAEAKDWMKDAVKHPGAFRKWLGKKKNEKVTQADIKKGLQSKNKRVRSMANLANTFAKTRKA